MELKWTTNALSDLVRLHEFLLPLNKQAAASTVQSLTAAPAKLLAQPRIGEKLEEFDAEKEFNIDGEKVTIQIKR